MTDLPHLIAGDILTEEMFRIYEAYLRARDLPVAGARSVPTAAVMNAAIDWWNALKASPAAGLYCLDPECDCREPHEEPTP